MFNNPGRKLKILALIVFATILINGVVLAFSFFRSSDGVSLLFIPLGALFGWLSSIVLYAFGELCENMLHTYKNIYIITRVIEEKNPEIIKKIR